MTMNTQWGGGLNPPEPLPMGGKGMRDLGFGAGLPSSAGRQITKNPMNMLGGMGSSSNGSYSNGSSAFDRGGLGFSDRGSIAAERIAGSLVGDRMGSGLVGERMGDRLGDRMGDRIVDRMGDRIGDRIGTTLGDRISVSGIPTGMSVLNKMSQQQTSISSTTNGNGYIQDGYGMGAMGGRPQTQQQQRSPPSTRYNGFGSSGSLGGGLERNLSGGGSSMSNMGGGGGMGYGESRGMGERGMSESGLGGVDRRMYQQREESREMRELREYQEMKEMRELQYRKEMMSRDLVRSTSELGGADRGGMMGYDRGMMGGGGRNEMVNRGADMMGRSVPPRDMMGGGGGGGGRDYLRSNSDMMGMRGGGGDTMGSRDRMEAGGVGGRRDMMDQSRDMPYPRDMMGTQRSMSVSNGSYGMSGESNGYSRSMSYHGGPPSPPGGNDMKIGTWNDGNSMNASNPSSFPPVSNFEIGTFNINDPGSRSFGSGGNSYGHGNGLTQSNNGPIQPGMGIRETGIIEKLLHSYGFIQCCDRQARLFFHFSQFEGNIEHLKIGDPVEFEMTYDRRTGKPIASAVSKIAPEVVMSEERVIGTVTTEIKPNASEGGNETQGRISYENRGECFFLPFNTTDVEGNVTLAAGDKVSFQMATVQRSGNLAAKTIRLENPAAPVKYQGVVNSQQEAFGFIERADVVKEIFFHVMEVVEGVKEDNSHIQLGDDVEFIIQTRNGKEVACNLTKLPPGTVIFEDVGIEFFRGQVLKPLDRTGKYAQNDALPGRVKYRAADRSEAEIPFGEKDQLADFTLRHGDWVKFIVATDRRDKLKRATKIEILDESFKVSDERREQGVVQSTKEGFGFLKCVDRSEKMFFHFSECLDVSRQLTLGDEVEFTVAADPTQLGRQLATRIKNLPPGTVKFDIIIAQNILGIVAEEPSAAASWGGPRSPTKSGESPVKEGAGRVVYELNGLQLSIPLYAGDCDVRCTPRLGDKVQFNINQLKSTKETNAVNVIIVETAHVVVEQQQQPQPPPPQQLPLPVAAAVAPVVVVPAAVPAVLAGELESPPREKKDASHRLGSPQRGYVAALKDGFGFIETLQHDKEIFFHFSHMEGGKAEKLEVGQEVEYSIYSREKGGKVSAEGVKPLPKGSIPKTVCKDEMLYGKVVRPLRSVNPDQADYCGLIVSKTEEGKVLGEYQFGIASLLNKKELLQEGDPVNFQVSSNEPFAINIKSNKQKLRSHVEAVKGQFGFLSYEQEEGKKLFFHMSEVEGGEVLQVGDQVEFVVVTNPRTKKHSACCVRKLCVSQRPERLISKLKTMSLEEVARGGPRIVVVRQPRGPDGSRGFAPRWKQEDKSEVVMDLMEQLTAQ